MKTLLLKLLRNKAKIMILALTYLASTQVQAQIPEIYSSLDFSELSSNIFLPLGYDCELPDGSTYENLSNGAVQQILFSLHAAQVNGSTQVPDFFTFDNSMKSINSTTQHVPISVIDFTCHTFKPTAIDDGLLGDNGTSYIDLTGPFETPYIEESVVAFYADVDYYDTPEMTFVLNQDCFISNHSTLPDLIEIDFDDGQGFRTVEFGVPIQVVYAEYSDRILRLNITRNGLVKRAASTLKTDSSSAWVIPDPGNVPWPDLMLDSANPYLLGSDEINGNWTEADAYTLISNDGIFDKPFIFVEGIDFGWIQQPLRNGSFGWPQFASGVSQSYPMMQEMPQLLAPLRNMGYDIILLDFKDGANYIQDNASTLVELINRCNNYKVGNHPLVVAGASMGGQVARYALRWMEMNDLDHCTQLYISLDSPHKGATIPLNLQHLLRANSYDSIEAIMKLNHTLFRPAARQMLIEQLPNETDPSEYAMQTDFNVFCQHSYGVLNQLWSNPWNLFEDFQSELDAMGLPQLTTNVAISNGNDHGQNIPMGNSLLHYTCNAYNIESNIDIQIEVDRSDLTLSNCIFIRDIPTGFNYVYRKKYEYHFQTLQRPPYDRCPGGVGNSVLEFVTALNYELSTSGAIDNGCPPVGINQYEPNHCFVSTASALGIDLEHIMTDLSQPNAPQSPFDLTYSPSSGNEPHSEVNASNIAFILDVVSQNQSTLPELLTANSPNSGLFNITGAQAVVNDIIVGDGGVLQINGNFASEFGYDTESIPAIGGHTNVKPRICSSYMTIESGGLLHIGDGAAGELDNTANFHITDGYTLTVEENGELILDDKSKLIIERGGLVIFRGNIKAGDLAKIEVEAGGAMLVEGALIKPKSLNIWHGIEVQGNSLLSQLDVNNQGYLKLCNGATITGAKCAVRVVANNEENGWDVDWSTTGGIVEALGAVFVDNNKDVEFLKYENTDSNGNLLPNQSRFINCEFTTHNSSYFEDPHPSITLYKCDHILFKGCHFEDYRTGIPLHQKRTGIFTIGSSVRVNEQCGANNPMGNYTCDGTPTRFVNLKYGLEMWDYTNPLFAPSIKNSSFENCWKGIYMSGILAPNITLNDFEVFSVDEPLPFNNLPVGLYLDHGCYDYLVTENLFHTPNAPADLSVGIVVSNGHGTNSEIYKNEFKNLYMGIEALDQNRPVSFNSYEGLIFQCNGFTHNVVDMSADGFAPNAPIVGVNQHQGENSLFPSETINNNFDYPDFLEWNFYNGGEHLFYTVVGEALNQQLEAFDPSKIVQSIMEQTVADIACPSKIGFEDLIVKGEELEFEIEEIEVKNQILSELLDGGDSQVLLSVVSHVNASTVLVAYERMMACEGYVSELVLETMCADEEMFSSAMIRDVLVDNTHSAKSSRILDVLAQRKHKLPRFMMVQIMQGESEVSPLEKLRNEIAGHKIRFDLALQSALRTVTADSTITDKPAALSLWQSGTLDVNWELKRAIRWDGMGELELADSLFQEMSSTFSQEELTDAGMYDYLELRELLYNWNLSGKDITALDEASLSTLLDYAHKPNISGSKALGLLRLNEASDYVPPVVLPSNEVGRRFEWKEEVWFSESRMGLYPNPASNFANLTYQIDAEFAQGRLLIVDGQGRQVYSRGIQNQVDEILIDLETFSVGTYEIMLLADGKLTISKSLIVNK